LEQAAQNILIPISGGVVQGTILRSGRPCAQPEQGERQLRIPCANGLCQRFRTGFPGNGICRRNNALFHELHGAKALAHGLRIRAERAAVERDGRTSPYGRSHGRASPYCAFDAQKIFLVQAFSLAVRRPFVKHKQGRAALGVK